jgi:hypothetical protein
MLVVFFVVHQNLGIKIPRKLIGYFNFPGLVYKFMKILEFFIIFLVRNQRLALLIDLFPT